MTGKCTRECDEYGHSDSCWMPVGNGSGNGSSSKMASSSSSYEAFGSPSYGSPGGGEEVLGHPTEEIPLAPTGEYKPTTCGTLTRREVYL
uniref:Protocadherin domain-containing protein n=1 Tax=Sphaeramia orbicularis TaxID=375764 RepID=A0A673AII2_9TELE